MRHQIVSYETPRHFNFSQYENSAFRATCRVDLSHWICESKFTLFKLGMAKAKKRTPFFKDNPYPDLYRLCHERLCEGHFVTNTITLIFSAYCTEIDVIHNFAN